MALKKEFNSGVIKTVSKEDREVIVSTIDELMCRYLGFSNNPEFLKKENPGKECYTGPFANEDGSFGIKLVYSRSAPEERPHNLGDFFTNKMFETGLGIHATSQGYWEEGREVRCTTKSTVSQTIEALRKLTDEYKQETKLETIKETVKLFDRYLSDNFKKLTPIECEEAVKAIKKKLPEMGIRLVEKDEVKPKAKILTNGNHK